MALEQRLPNVMMSINEAWAQDFICAVVHFSIWMRLNALFNFGNDVAFDKEISCDGADMIACIKGEHGYRLVGALILSSFGDAGKIKQNFSFDTTRLTQE
jgi:hypothetical protein